MCLQLSIVTCMDSRLLIDKMLPGVDIGDVEIIRNAGDTCLVLAQ
jgi:carbonic anhydrase